MNYQDLLLLYKKVYESKISMQKPIWLGEFTTDNGEITFLTIPQDYYEKVFSLQDELFSIQLQICQLGLWGDFLEKQLEIELEVIKDVFDDKLAKLFFPLHFDPNFLDNAEG